MKTWSNPLYWIDVAVFLAFSAVVVTQVDWHARQILGVSLAATGFVLWMTARFQLGQSFTISAQARNLVTTGLYSKFRHPVYLFAGVAYAGLFLAWGNWIALAAFLVFYMYQLPRMRKEERVLEQAFREEYRRYRAKTWL
jgi:protein-S-isoprenylcysteine O-methyltransferase Ste14